MITYFDYATLPVTPWKNGAGATREIIAVPSVDAPFSGEPALPPCRPMALSPLPGVDRTIVLLAGQPLRLRGEEIDHPLALWQPWAFPGEWALSSVGIVEPGLDFNIMTQRGRASARLKW
jgi:environmental stress-induced protein Ves